VFDLSTLNKARRLAFFLHRNQSLALKITAAALARVELMTARQDRRRAYTPKKHRTKVSLSPAQLLQSLIYCESELYEKQQESRVCKGFDPRSQDLLVRYVKHLVLISIQRNSFYLTLALCKFLYRYSTEETMAIYDLLSQDQGCRFDGDYYRSRKGVMLKQLKARFGPLLSGCRGARGEQQFKCHQASATETDLVRECLARFTLWNTDCVVPDQFNSWEEELPDLHSMDSGFDQETLVEVNRIHTVLHPECFLRLTQALGLDPPEQRLAIPNFS
jgi:hypothetical protein